MKNKATRTIWDEVKSILVEGLYLSLKGAMWESTIETAITNVKNNTATAAQKKLVESLHERAIEKNIEHLFEEHKEEVTALVEAVKRHEKMKSPPSVPPIIKSEPIINNGGKTWKRSN